MYMDVLAAAHAEIKISQVRSNVQNSIWNVDIKSWKIYYAMWIWCSNNILKS